jgi:hypothetical protein
MPNWYYTDTTGQKRGLINNDQLKALAARGIITPDTPLETDTGKNGKAGQIRGLFPAAQTVPPKVPVTVASKSKRLHWIIGIAAVLVISVIALLALSPAKQGANDNPFKDGAAVQHHNPFDDSTVEWKTDNPFDDPTVKSRKAGEPADPSTLIGKIMCGYQGWFHIKGDGSGLGNFHWGGDDFGPESYAHVDMWADMSEMDDDEKYPTRFRHADGSVAYAFSSTNRKTVARHFQWMEEYGIDGVFLQRFIGYAGDYANNNRVGHSFIGVMENVRYGAEKHNRAWAMMYDIGGARPGELMGLLVNDWKRLVDENKIREDRMYLHHNGKPVISLWGIGFVENGFTLREALELITFLQDDPKYGGNTVKIGVPTYWRTLDRDALGDPFLHEVIRKADIVSPWTVGRFGNVRDVENYVRGASAADMEWCRKNGVAYMPVVFPGFSWHNLMNSRGRKTGFNDIPRRRGELLSAQIRGQMNNGVTMIYQAMFDEIDEGTAIFKVTNDPPVGGVNRWVDYEGLPSDFYLKLVGDAAKELKRRTAEMRRNIVTDNPFAD